MSVQPEPIISIRNLEVSFLVKGKGVSSLKQYLISLGTKKLFQKKEIIKGLNLDIYPGETFGLLGRNGSGKSTLLRAISGIITPDKGTINVRGRIAPMLALGVGLEPEMTGVENIRLCATLMGFSKTEIEFYMPSIIEFSELSDQINLEVKRYSSGMMARLAFSIAVAHDPEILLVDEALAVGDMGFQVKCAKRIEELRLNGSTIVYVSHHLEELKRICDRAALLKDGVILKVGELDEIGELYLNEFK
jgi:lipopolysaccharide transport system ATP-binding protein